MKKTDSDTLPTKPNGAMIRTQEPCADCDKRHKAAMGMEKPEYILRVYNDRLICDRCAKKYGVL